MAAAGTMIGRGYVPVEPDFSGFQEKVAKRLNETLGPAMDRAGANASKRLSKSLGNNQSLRTSLQPLLKRFQKFGDSAGEEIAAHIGKGSKRASGDMFGLSSAIKEMEKRSSSASSRAKIFANDTFGIAHAARDAGQSYKLLRNATRDWAHDAKAADSVGKRLSKGITSLFGDVRDVGRNLKTAAGGFGNFEGIMARANRGFQFFRNILGSLKIPTLLAGVALLAQSLSALTVAAFATASALGPLSGALIALPALALAGAQAVGVLKLALSGIGAAVKAGLTAQIQGGEQATQTLRAQENAAEALADAHRTLASSERDEKFATEDLRKARKEATLQLEEMKRASDESRLSEEEGSLALREARRQLNKTLREPGATGLDIQSAEQAVERAKFGLESTREEAKKARTDYAEANKKGVKGMSEVVSARRALADANRSVSDAERGVAKAVRENTDAMKQQGSAATALDQKMAELTPTGRKFARFLISLKPQFDSLRETAAQGLFPGAEAGIHSLLSNAGVVKKVVAGTSSALGKLAAKAGAKLGSKAWGRDLGKVGAMNTRILTRMGDAGLNVADAFRNILVSAEPLLDWMSKGTVKFSEWLKTEAQVGRETGSLGHFFEETREAMERVWRILKPLGEGLLNVGKAAKPLGNEILDSLGGAAEGWAKWTDSVSGQNKLKNYFVEVKPAIFAIGRLVRDMTNDFFELGRQKGVATLVESIRKTLLPLLTTVGGATTGWLSGFIQRFSKLRREGVPLFAAFLQDLVEHAADAGTELVKALVTAFVNSDVWGRLALGGWLLAKFGGGSAFLKVGASLGRFLGLGISTGASEGIVGTSAGGGLLGRLKGIKWGRVAGLGLGALVANSVLDEYQRVTAEHSGDLATALGAKADTQSGVEKTLTGVTNFIGIKGKIDLPSLSQLFGVDQEQRAAKNLKAEFEEMAKKRIQLSKSTIESLRAQAKEVDLSKEARAQLEKMLDLAEQGRKLGLKVGLNSEGQVREIHAYLKGFDLLKSGTITRLGDISKIAGENLEHISAGFKAGTPKWRKAIVENMQASVDAIRAGMKEGVISTEQGQKRIHELARSMRLFEGRDPLGLAKGFSEGWARAGKVTKSQVEYQIAQLRKLPKAAQEQAREAMVRMARKMESEGRLVKGAASRLNSALTTTFGRLGGSFESLSGVVGESLQSIIVNTKRALDSLGVKGALKQFTIQHPNFVYGTANSPNLARQRGGPVPAFATGGLASVVPGNSTGDRHVLALNGRPIAKVESREGIFVGNRKMMAAAKQANDAVPRFKHGGFVGLAQQLKRGGLVEPKLDGNGGPLKQLGKAAIHKVFEGAKDYLDKHQSTGALGGLTGSGPVESVFAKVAKKLSRSKIATLALGEAGFAESRMRDLGYGDATSQGSLQLLASTAASMGIDPHDEGAVASAFLLTGYTGKGGANKLAAQGLPAQLVAQGVQGSAFSDGSNYLAQEGAAKGWMRRFGLQSGGLLKGLARGGSIGDAIQRLAAGGMVDPGWDPGSETLASSIAQLVGEYAKRYDADITAGFDPGGGHVSPGHNVTGTATDVVPRDGNWDGAFAKGLEELASLGFEVGYDGSIPGTQSWPDHGRGNHAHIEWVGNGTAGDARQRLREFLGGVSGSSTAGPAAPPKEDIPVKYRGALTKPINFPPMPKHLAEVAKEITRWQGEVGTYRSAKGYAEKQGKPGTAQAIGRNLNAIEQRLAGLRQLHSRLRLQGAKKALSKRLKGAFKKFGAYDQVIEGNELGYNAAAQFAEQVVALEPQSPELSANATDAQREAAEKSYVASFKDYVDGQERPAYSRVLEKVADWRNSILRAETFGFVGKGQPSVESMETRWEGEDRGIGGQIDHIKDFSKKVGERVTDFRRSNKGALPDWLQKQVRERDSLRDQLPILQLKDTSLRKSIQEARERFFPGGDNRLGPDKTGLPKIPLAGSGSLEEALRTIQGIHWPELHELLSASALAPPRLAGRFGGVIWDVETSIEELGLKVSQAFNGLGSGGGSSTEGDSERSSLLEQLLREANQRRAVDEAQGHALEGWDKMREGLAANLPKFHTGGIIPGPSNREIPIMARGREGVFTEEQMAAMGAGGGHAGPPIIEHLEIHSDGRVTMRYEGREFEAAVERVTRKTRGVGVLTPGGARR